MVNRHLYPVSLLFSRLPYKEVQLATAVVIGDHNYFGLLFAICTSAIIHFDCPPKFCITFALYNSRPKRNRRQYKLCKLLGASKVYYGRCGNGELWLSLKTLYYCIAIFFWDYIPALGIAPNVYNWTFSLRVQFPPLDHLYAFLHVISYLQFLLQGVRKTLFQHFRNHCKKYSRTWLYSCNLSQCRNKIVCNFCFILGRYLLQRRNSIDWRRNCPGKADKGGWFPILSSLCNLRLRH